MAICVIGSTAEVVEVGMSARAGGDVCNPRWAVRTMKIILQDRLEVRSMSIQTVDANSGSEGSLSKCMGCRYNNNN